MRTVLKRGIAFCLMLAVCYLGCAGQDQDKQKAELTAKPPARLTIEIEPEQSTQVPVAINVIFLNLSKRGFGFWSGWDYPSAIEFSATLTLPNGENKKVLRVNWSPTLGSDLGISVKPGETVRTPMIITSRELRPHIGRERRFDNPDVQADDAHFPPGQYRLVIATNEKVIRGHLVLPRVVSPEVTFIVTDDPKVRDARLRDRDDPKRFPKMFREDIRKRVVPNKKD
ncbi:MAG: hypothetical protein AB1696_25385 [Planctomycetota bacterium]